MSPGQVSQRLIVAGHTDPGQRRALNEDAWHVAEAAKAGASFAARGQLIAVADGMGGHAAGEVASKLAIETLFAGYYDSDDAPMSPVMRLEQAVLAANARIYEQAEDQVSEAGMGTTMVAAVVHGAWLTVANVGDSRAYLIRQGRAQQITRDHSWVAEQVAAGLLTESQAQNHTYRSVVTRCLGHHPQIAVDTFELVLAPGDQVLLCSDGLSNLVSEEEMVRVAADHAPERAVLELVDLANRYGGPDNITAVVIAVVDERQAAARAETRQLARVSPGKARSQPGTRDKRRARWWAIPLFAVLLVLCLIGTAWAVWGPERIRSWLTSPTATQTIAPTATQMPVATETTAPTATQTATAAPSATPTATVTRTATVTATATQTTTAAQTATATAAQTTTATAAQTTTATAAQTATTTLTATAEQTIAATATTTGTVEATATTQP